MLKHDVIAIDLDEIFNSDSKVWSTVIRLLQLNNYKVICTTLHNWAECDDRYLKKALLGDLDIVFCGDQFKRIACEAAGYNVTIWIDNCPKCIDKSSGLAWVERLKSFFHSTKNWILRKVGLK